MSGQPAFVQCLTQQAKDGSLLDTFTTAKLITNPEDSVPPDGNYMRVGTAFEIDLWGALSNIAASPGNVFFQVMMGTIIVWSSGNLAFNAAARVLLPFHLRVKLRVVTTGIGTAATIRGFGEFSGVHLTGAQAITQLPITAPAVGAGFDSTIAARLETWAGFSVSDVGNGVRVDDYNVKQYAF